ncbi:GNAT family N-acetyltransferase [Phaeovulum sp. W22_SRMD_FR3]
MARTHADAVLTFYRRAADYVQLETGTLPDMGLVEEFFADVPPGCDPARSLKLGLYLPHPQGDGAGEGAPVLAGIADLGFGYPEARDAYLGLLLLAPEARGQNWGQRFLRHLRREAELRGARRLVLAVLADNPRGRAFWEREGFRIELTTPPMQMGRRLNVRHRMVLDL